MTTRRAVRWCSNFLAAALLMQLATGPVLGVARRVTPKREDDDARGSLAESQLAARQAASSRSGSASAESLEIEPSIARDAARPTGLVHDLAVVPFKMMVNKNKGGMVYDRTRAYFVDHQFKVAPKSQVEGAIKELGLLSNEAIQLPDCDAICRALGCRYLSFGTVKLPKADTGFSPVGGAVASASTLLGGVGGLAAASALPFAAGVLAVSAVGGFTTASTVDIECRLYDNKVQKVIWVGTETFTAKKHLLAVFADKQQLQQQALSAALKKLFDPVVHKLQPMKGRTQVD